MAETVEGNGTNEYDEGRGAQDRRKKKSKGRGHAHMDTDRYEGRGGIFERIEQESNDGPAQCILPFNPSISFFFSYLNLSLRLQQ
jgi:hypothetical protein